MKYAIVKIGGKQLKISEGETFRIERQESLDFNVLAFSDNGDTIIGTPYLDKVKIKATILGEEMGNKVTVGRFKSKSRYQKKKGHRQPLSLVKIESIGEAKPKAEPKAEVKSEPKAEPKAEAKPAAVEEKKKPVKKAAAKAEKTTKKAPVKSSKGKEKA
jgi:large subunit ribosomal protein L21